MAKKKSTGKYNSKPSGKLGKNKGLTNHHGNGGKEVAKKMPRDRVADTRKVAN